MSIKMICSDLDGTILTYHQTKLSNRLLDQIRELKRRGILFVPTSGRQIVSMQKLFAPVADCCYYICANGAVICDGTGAVLDSLPMPREDALTIAHDFLDKTDGRGEVNIAGKEICHLISKDLGMVDRLTFIGNKFEVIEKPEDVTEEIVKVSVFVPDGSVNYVERFLKQWEKYNPAIAGEFWIDTVLADKGLGVELLSRRLGIQPDEVMAFGDNYNDVSMLDAVGHPFIMSGACEELRKRYPNHIDSVEEKLEEFLNA